jgi:hypothetical protein
MSLQHGSRTKRLEPGLSLFRQSSLTCPFGGP